MSPDQKDLPQGFEIDVQNVVDAAMRADRNGDGMITLREAAELGPEGFSPHSPIRASEKAERLLSLDANGDGILSSAEMEALVRAAVKILDENKNMRIDGDERTRLHQRVRQRTERERNQKRLLSECRMPALSPTEKLLMVGAMEGVSYSNVSVAGQTAITYAAELDIGHNKGSYYVVLASAEPVIWDVKGDASSITHLVVAGPRHKTGVRGVSRDRVTFVFGEPCFLDLGGDVGPGERNLRDAKKTLRLLLGKEPVSALAARRIAGVSLGAGDAFSLGEGTFYTDRTVPRRGFDPQIWEYMVLPYERPLVQFDVEDVVSGARPLELYSIPLGIYGLASLVDQGALEFLPDTEGQRNLSFKLKRRVTHFPLGLDKFRTPEFSFLVPRDVPVPDGKAYVECQGEVPLGEMRLFSVKCKGGKH